MVQPAVNALAPLAIHAKAWRRLSGMILKRECGSFCYKKYSCLGSKYAGYSVI
jgi:hypothetical protein